MKGAFQAVRPFLGLERPEGRFLQQREAGLRLGAEAGETGQFEAHETELEVIGDVPDDAYAARIGLDAFQCGEGGVVGGGSDIVTAEALGFQVRDVLLGRIEKFVGLDDEAGAVGIPALDRKGHGDRVGARLRERAVEGGVLLRRLHGTGRKLQQDQRVRPGDAIDRARREIGPFPDGKVRARADDGRKEDAPSHQILRYFQEDMLVLPVDFHEAAVHRRSLLAQEFLIGRLLRGGGRLLHRRRFLAERVPPRLHLPGGKERQRAEQYAEELSHCSLVPYSMVERSSW